MYQLRRWGSLGLAMIVTGGLLLAGCIKPVNEAGPTPTAMPGVAVPNQVAPPAAGLPDGGALVQQFILGRGDTPTDLQVWYQEPRGPDQLYGFSHTNAGGLPCVGFLLVSVVNGLWQPTNGALLCAPQLGLQAMAHVSLFATTDGQPYTVVFGRVFDPTISAIAVVYNDGSNQALNPILGGFMFVKPGIFETYTITAVNQQGNTVIDNIPQLPAS